jgi:putative lipoic acid-binding regulatory protein
MSNKTQPNGKAKTSNDISNEEIKFPINFDFKAVMDATIDDDENKQNLVDVFSLNKIKYAYHSKKISGKGTYVSFTYKITIVSKEVMNKFYVDLKAVKGLKFAL